MIFLKNVLEKINPFVGPLQWRIRDFPEEGAPTPEWGTSLLFGQFSQKLHENEEILGQTGGGGHTSLAIQCRSTTALIPKFGTSGNVCSFVLNFWRPTGAPVFEFGDICCDFYSQGVNYRFQRHLLSS